MGIKAVHKMRAMTALKLPWAVTEPRCPNLGVSGVGVGALSIGGWGATEKGEPAHVTLLGAHKIIIGVLKIPDELAGGRLFLTAFPVPLKGCGGAWTLAIAGETHP